MATVKHATLRGWAAGSCWCREWSRTAAWADEANVVVDWQGCNQRLHAVIVSTDGDIARAQFGNTTPARMVVMGIVDEIHAPAMIAAVSAWRLGIVRGHVVLNPLPSRRLPGRKTGRNRTGVDGKPARAQWKRRRQRPGRDRRAWRRRRGQMVAFTEGQEASNPFWPDSGAGGRVLRWA